MQSFETFAGSSYERWASREKFLHLILALNLKWTYIGSSSNVIVLFCQSCFKEMFSFWYGSLCRIYLQWLTNVINEQHYGIHSHLNLQLPLCSWRVVVVMPGGELVERPYSLSPTEQFDSTQVVLLAIDCNSVLWLCFWLINVFNPVLFFKKENLNLFSF